MNVPCPFCSLYEGHVGGCPYLRGAQDPKAKRFTTPGLTDFPEPKSQPISQAQREQLAVSLKADITKMHRALVIAKQVIEMSDMFRGPNEKGEALKAINDALGIRGGPQDEKDESDSPPQRVGGMALSALRAAKRTIELFGKTPDTTWPLRSIDAIISYLSLDDGPTLPEAQILTVEALTVAKKALEKMGQPSDGGKALKAINEALEAQAQGAPAALDEANDRLRTATRAWVKRTRYSPKSAANSSPLCGESWASLEGGSRPYR
jgi:hypothetical protein